MQEINGGGGAAQNGGDTQMTMAKTKIDGQVVNTRTANMIQRAQRRAGYNFTVVQGSYNQGGVAASGGTHDGGGAADFSVKGLTKGQIDDMVLALREVGFAAWHRLPGQGPWEEHVHAVAIEDPDLSPAAAAQIEDYYEGKNGLVGRGPDDGPRLVPIPVWPVDTPSISLRVIVNQFTKDGPRTVLGVARVQELLNRRINAGLKVDGIAKAETRKAWKQWENKIGVNNPDREPQQNSLKKLVDGFYRVIA